MTLIRRSIAAALLFAVCLSLAACSTEPSELMSAKPSPSPVASVEASAGPSVEASAEPSARVSTLPPPEDAFYFGEQMYTPRTTVAFASDEDDLSRLSEMTLLHALSLTIGDASAFDFSLITGLPSLTTLELIVTGSADADLTALDGMALTTLTVRITGEADGLVLPKSDTLESLTVQPPAECESFVIEGCPLLCDLGIEGIGEMQTVRVVDCPAIESVSVTVDGSLGALTVEGGELHSIVLMGPGSVGSVDAPSLEYLSLRCGSVGDVRLAERVENGSIVTFCAAGSVVYPADELLIQANGELDLDAFVGCEGLRELAVDDQYPLDFAALESFPALEEIELKVGGQSVLEVSAEEDLWLLSSKSDAYGKRCFISTSTLEELELTPEHNIVYAPDALASLNTTLDAEQIGYLTAYCERGGLLQLVGRNP